MTEKKITNARRVMDAIDNTPKGHWDSILAMRSDTDEAKGSYYPAKSTYKLHVDLLQALSYKNVTKSYHPAITGGSEGFIVGLSGVTGIINLAWLDPEVELSHDQGHNSDEDGEAQFSLCWTPESDDDKFLVRSTAKTKKTTLILCQHEGKEVVATFHPGDPIVPKTVAESQLDNCKTVGDARRLGHEYAKIVNYK